MPTYPAGATIITTAKKPSMTLYALAKKERTISFPAGAPPNGNAEFVAMVEAIADISTMGLLSYTNNGQTVCIPDGLVSVWDEMYHHTETATLVFQDFDFANDEVRILVPAPDAGIFSTATGVTTIDPVSAHPPLETAVNAIRAWLNDNPTTPLIANYSFVGGWLNTARGNERRIMPSIVEPTGDAGDPV